MKTVAFGLVTLTLPACGFIHHRTPEYSFVRVQGHPVYISPEAAGDKVLVNRVTAKLDSDLKNIHAILPARAMSQLAGLAFWVEQDNPETPGMTYHPSAAWLQEHGYNTDKAGGIEIGNLRHFLDWRADQPMMVLHEVSHAYHDQVLGFDHVTVRWAYDNAVSSHRYESVPYVRGGSKRAYALTNEKEYFAEMSEAYWGRNDFYPFNRTELEKFDPAGFQMVEKLWLNP